MIYQFTAHDHIETIFFLILRITIYSLEKKKTILHRKHQKLSKKRGDNSYKSKQFCFYLLAMHMETKCLLKFEGNRVKVLFTCVTPLQKCIWNLQDF